MHNGYYQPHEWQALSTDECTQVLEARGTKRSINGVEITLQRDDNASGITEPTRATQGNADNAAISGSSGGISGAGSQFGRRSIGGIHSRRHHRVPNMRISQTRMWRLNSSNLEGTYRLTELNSHADTACLGKNFRVIAHTDRVCKVSPHHPDYPPMSDVQAATACDDPESGETFLLITWVRHWKIPY